MLKALALIGMMCVGSIFAATVEVAAAALPPVEDLDTQLRKAHTRATNAATFETVAAQSAMVVDHGMRSVFNTDLVAQFTVMEAELGVSPLFALKTIETQEKAEGAVLYYRGVKKDLISLIQTITAKMDQEMGDE